MYQNNKTNCGLTWISIDKITIQKSDFQNVYLRLKMFFWDFDLLKDNFAQELLKAVLEKNYQLKFGNQ